jgi:hypothetical protein
MTRGPHGIPEEVLMEFVTVVVLATVVIAFVAYIGTSFSAMRQQRKGGTDAQSPSTSDLSDRRGDRPHEPARERPATSGRPVDSTRAGVGTLRR